MSKLLIMKIEDGTIEKEFDTTEMGERKADRLYSGLSINLDRERFYLKEIH